MSGPQDDLYIGLSELLKDISSFLSKQETLSKLSLEERGVVNQLLQRSKVKLQEITKCTEYVVMHPQLDASMDNADYASIQEPVIPMTNIKITNANNKWNDPVHKEVVPNTNSCPFAELPAKDIINAIKFGSLSWKVKMVLNLSKMRRVFAAIQGHFMLIYGNENEGRPLICLDLHHHEAKEIPNNSKNVYFEVTSTKTGEKYVFSSPAFKDRRQWLIIINKYHDEHIMHSKRSSSIIPVEPIEPDNLSDEDNNGYWQIEPCKKYIPPQPIRPPELPKRPPTVVEPEIYYVPTLPRAKAVPPPVVPTVKYESQVVDDDSFSDDDDDDPGDYVVPQMIRGPTVPTSKPPPIKPIKQSSFIHK